ncbi:MAG: hypothetical protein JNJ77_20360 [Planctomycetia bacterium]|nr:hypothetical protein [Planctomycetia bacterium]
MSAVQIHPAAKAIPPELRKYQLTQLPKDLEQLKKGANHLRVIAWFICVPAVFMGFVSFMFLLMRPMPGNQFLFLIMLAFLGVAAFYFSVSNYIRRARRWAVYVAILVAILPILITIPLILMPNIGIHKRTPWSMVIEMIYLIGHIKMIRDLIICLGAVDRIHWAAKVRSSAESQTDPWDISS